MSVASRGTGAFPADDIGLVHSLPPRIQSVHLDLRSLSNAPGEKRLLHLLKRLASCKYLIVDEFGSVPLTRTSADSLFEMFSRRYERNWSVVTGNHEWTEVLDSECLTGAFLNQLTHYFHIIEMNGESHRLNLNPRGPDEIHRLNLPPHPACTRGLRGTRPRHRATCIYVATWSLKLHGRWHDSESLHSPIPVIRACPGKAIERANFLKSLSIAVTEPPRGAIISYSFLRQSAQLTSSFLLIRSSAISLTRATISFMMPRMAGSMASRRRLNSSRDMEFTTVSSTATALAI